MILTSLPTDRLWPLPDRRHPWRAPAFSACSRRRQRSIGLATLQRKHLSRIKPYDFTGAFVNVHIDASASIAMPARIGDHPLTRGHIRKIVEPWDRPLSHNRKSPASILVIEPPVSGRRVLQPTAAIFPSTRNRMGIEKCNRDANGKRAHYLTKIHEKGRFPDDFLTIYNSGQATIPGWS